MINTATPATKAYLLLTFTALCWGCNAVFGRLAVGQVSPMLLVTLRWLGVLLLLLLFARRQFYRDRRALYARWRFVALLAVLGFTAFNALFYIAAHTTTAVNIGILQGSIPVFVLLGAFLAYRSRTTPLQAVGVAVTLLGVIAVASGGELARLTGLAFNQGDLLMLLACGCYSGYAVGLRNRPPVSALALFAAMAGVAFATSLPLTVAELWLGQLQWPTPTGWTVIALVVLLPSFLAQLSFIQGVTLIGPGRAGVFVNLVPVFASILAVTFLHEPFEPYHGLALLLVLCGIWLSERGGKTR